MRISRAEKKRLRPFLNQAVAQVFDTYPPEIRRCLLALRELIFNTASSTPGVGELEEALRWGEPAYLTPSKSGSTIRISWKRSIPARYAVCFVCHTNLVETFRMLFPDDFNFEGNRAIVFHQAEALPGDTLAFCIAAALTYHLDKRTS
jgi:hypothetical protein